MTFIFKRLLCRYKAVKTLLYFKQANYNVHKSLHTTCRHNKHPFKYSIYYNTCRLFSSTLPTSSGTEENKDNTLLNDVDTEINSMSEDPTRLDDAKTESTIQKIRSLDPFAIDDKLNLAAARFMTLYHQKRVRKATKEEQHELLNEQYNDMKFGCILLQNVIDNSSDEALMMPAMVLKTQVAMIMQDSNSLKESFNQMLEYETKFTHQHLVIAFAATSYLGQWEQMKKFGETLKSVPDVAFPTDYEIILELCEKYELFDKKNEVNETALSWQTFNVLTIRIKLKDIDCEEFEEKKKESMKEIAGDRPVEWENVPRRHSDIKKMGAICQTDSFCQESMVLCGLWIGNKINIMGREKFVGNNGLVMNVEEEWNLDQHESVDRLYVGNYRLSQTVELDSDTVRTAETAPIHLDWECELYLGEPINHTS